MGFWTIAGIVALKGAILGYARKRGWWPNWEERARRRAEEKKVLVAYREWRKARANRSPDPRITR